MDRDLGAPAAAGGRSILRRLCALLLAISLPGCWSMRYRPGEREWRAPVEAGRPGIVVAVDEAGVAWGDGRLGDEIRTALAGSGLFEQAYYPIEPPAAPALRLEVEALADEDENVVWGTIGALAIGYFLFLPALVFPFFDEFEIACSNRLLEDGAEVVSFEVKSEARFVHAIFASAQELRDEAREAVYRDLADQIAARLVEWHQASASIAP